MGRGAASAGAKQWTAFEPATSVTHPYWCQAEHSLTTQRFSKHSVAPGTVGVNGGKGDGGRGGRMDGEMNGWMEGWHTGERYCQSRCYGGTTKRQWETPYSVLCPVGRFSERSPRSHIEMQNEKYQFPNSSCKIVKIVKLSLNIGAESEFENRKLCCCVTRLHIFRRLLEMQPSFPVGSFAACPKIHCVLMVGFVCPKEI